MSLSADLFSLAQASTREDSPVAFGQANLRRAVSTAYYAVFHMFLETAADIIAGDTAAQRPNRAWRQMYRTIEHKKLFDACEESRLGSLGFPSGIRDFAEALRKLKDAREKADYDPFYKFEVATVRNLVGQAGSAIDAMQRASSNDKRAFLIMAIAKYRKDT